MVMTLSKESDCRPDDIQPLLGQECFSPSDAHRVGTLVCIQLPNEIRLHARLIDARDPGNSPLCLRMLKSRVVVQYRPRMDFLCRHSQSECQRDVVPDDPGFREIIFPYRFEKTIIPSNEFSP